MYSGPEDDADHKRHKAYDESIRNKLKEDTSIKNSEKKSLDPVCCGSRLKTNSSHDIYEAIRKWQAGIEKLAAYDGDELMCAAMK